MKMKQLLTFTTRDMTLYGMLAALMLVVSFTPLGFGFAFVGVPSNTLLHIFVLIPAFLGNVRGSVILGLVFGVISLLRALLAPNGPFDLLFINPLISVLPRLLFGIAAGAIGWGVHKIAWPNAKVRAIGVGIFAFISTLIHTILVIGALYLFYAVLPIDGVTQEIYDVFNAPFLGTLQAVIATNGLVEAGFAAVIVPAVAWSLRKYAAHF